LLEEHESPWVPKPPCAHVVVSLLSKMQSSAPQPVSLTGSQLPVLPEPQKPDVHEKLQH
jgi:hypothetical protein